MKNEWETINDVQVRHVWNGSNGDQVYVSPDWYEDNGTPVDPETGDDMTYSHTEIRKAEPGA